VNEKDEPQEVVALIRGRKGEKGEKGTHGTRGEPGMPRNARVAVIFLFALAFLLGGFNLFWSSHLSSSAQAAQRQQQLEQRRAGVLVEVKLCTTLDKLAALQPPPGNPRKNPSRAYLQDEHTTLAQLGTDIGCKR
jgi:hypothetical protein